MSTYTLDWNPSSGHIISKKNSDCKDIILLNVDDVIVFLSFLLEDKMITIQIDSDEFNESYNTELRSKIDPTLLDQIIFKRLD